jgi:L-cysteine/cystine lyase
VTGNVLPVAELKRETGLAILVDGAQSGGAIEVDATPYDYYTVSGQKWPCGPDSTGALYVREPETLRLSAPTYLSQQRFDPDGAFEPTAGAARFDHGFLGATLLSGLEAALDGAPEWRFERARKTTARCRELLGERHQVVTAPGQGTLVAFRPEDEEPAAVVERLFEQGVVVREIPGSGLVRVSVGYWTSDDDLQRLLDGL